MISLWAIWFATALTEPAAIFACPMHSGITAAASAREALANAGPADVHHHAEDADQSASDATSPVSERKDHSCCTCLGQCCTMAPAMLRAEPFTLSVRIARQTAARGHALTARVPLPVAHRLPFANGPPHTTLS